MFAYVDKNRKLILPVAHVITVETYIYKPIIDPVNLEDRKTRTYIIYLTRIAIILRRLYLHEGSDHLLYLTVLLLFAQCNTSNS
jgi:hypothetical protein